MGLGQSAIDMVGRSESIEKQTDALLAFIFSWDLLTRSKILNDHPLNLARATVFGLLCNNS